MNNRIKEIVNIDKLKPVTPRWSEYEDRYDDCTRVKMRILRCPTCHVMVGSSMRKCYHCGQLFKRSNEVL